MINYLKGDLIKLAHECYFDVIVHGCNCFCTMGAGIAPQMVKAFGCHKFQLESESYKGDVNKMGNIDIGHTYIKGNDVKVYDAAVEKRWNDKIHEDEHYHLLKVINAYTQFGFGNPAGDLDYEALTLCMRKIAAKFRGQHIGLPKIGCGLAGGDWEIVEKIIEKELKDCKVTVVIFE